jgi:RNA polymerase sigma-B factor
MGYPALTTALLSRARSGDPHARERVAHELMPVAKRLARKFATQSHHADDLAQVASIGLLKAIERYDPERESSFITYAHALMTGEIRRHVRDSRMIRLPRSIYEEVPRFQRTLVSLQRELGRVPTRDEIATAMELSKEQVVEIADAAMTAHHISLDSALEEAGGENHIAGEDYAFEQVEAGIDLAPMLQVLSPRERMVIDLRFTDGLSQSEIAAAMQVSPTQVSRIIRAALAKLSARAGVPL